MLPHVDINSRPEFGSVSLQFAHLRKVLSILCLDRDVRAVLERSGTALLLTTSTTYIDRQSSSTAENGPNFHFPETRRLFLRDTGLHEKLRRPTFSYASLRDPFTFVHFHNGVALRVCKRSSPPGF